MSFELKKEVNESTYFVKIVGLMDYSTIDGFEFNIPEGISKIVVDFATLDFIDSTGIGAILSIIYAATERGIFIEFVGLNETLSDLFKTVGVFDIIEVLQMGGTK
ncbi:MAG: hypothetical protein JWM44_1354 [Bacilli bacterium]|nr:hypothetical protein [Bacilli bacterium]